MHGHIAFDATLYLAGRQYTTGVVGVVGTNEAHVFVSVVSVRLVCASPSTMGSSQSEWYDRCVLSALLHCLHDQKDWPDPFGSLFLALLLLPPAFHPLFSGALLF